MNMDLLQKMRTSSLRNVGRRGNNSTARSRGLSEPLMSDMDEHIEMGKVSSSKSIDMMNQQKPKEKCKKRSWRHIIKNGLCWKNLFSVLKQV